MKRKMLRIVHVVMNRSFPAQLPGVHRQVYSLAEAESRLGMDVSIWDIGTHRTVGNIDKVDHRSFDVQSNRLLISPAMKVALDELTSPSIIHIHGGFIPEYFALSRYLRKSRKKIRVVLSPHGDYSEIKLRGLSLLRRAYYYLFERPVIKLASLVHLLGPSEVNGYNFFMNEETPFVCLPNGIANGHRHHAGSKKVYEDPFVVTYSGDLSIIAKGLDLLMDAFTKFYLDVATPVELWIIGEGKDREALRAMAERVGVESKVKFFGKIPRKRREEIFLKTSVFICPSRNGSCSDHSLEAAAVGVPMIVSEETNLGTFVRQYEAGWCLSRNTEEHLRQALHEAYVFYKSNAEGYASLQRRSVSMIREEFNWNTLARKWKEVYSAVS